MERPSMTREAGEGRGKVLGLLGTLGELFLGYRAHALPKAMQSVLKEPYTPHIGVRKSCGLSLALTDCELSLLLSLDLFLANLFFFLCRGLDSRIISSNSKVGSQCRRPFCVEAQDTEPRLWMPPHPNLLELPVRAHSLLTLGTKPGSTFFSLRSSQSTWASDGAVCMSWRLENRCSGFTVRSCKKAPLSDESHRRMATCPRLEQPLKVSTGLQSRTSGSQVTREERWHQAIWPEGLCDPSALMPKDNRGPAGTSCQDLPAGGSGSLDNVLSCLHVGPTNYIKAT